MDIKRAITPPYFLGIERKSLRNIRYTHKNVQIIIYEIQIRSHNVKFNYRTFHQNKSHILKVKSAPHESNSNSNYTGF